MDPRHVRGARAERIVAAYLAERGWDVIGQNVRLGHLEIDIVAVQGPLAIVVEVRTRCVGAWQAGFTSVSPLKQMRLLRAAERLWRFHLAQRPGIERMRIDVAAVTWARDGTPRVDYARGAIVG